MKRRSAPILAGLAAAVLCAAAPGGLDLPRVDGLVSDAGTWLRWRTGLAQPPATSVAVVSVDARSLASRDLRGVPRLLLGPVWGQATQALVEAGAKAVVFDIVFATSMDDWMRRQRLNAAPDRPFLQVLQEQQDRIVLARTGGTVPAVPFRLALGADEHAGRLGLAEIEGDEDGVVRHVVQSVAGPDGPLPTLSAAAAALAGHPSSLPTVRPRVDGPLEQAIPVIPLEAVRACPAGPDGTAKLAGLVRDRVVFIGTTLAEEDRRFAGDRFVLPMLPEPAQTPVTPCAAGPAVPSAPATGTVPAVFLHAAATAALLEGRGLVEASPWSRAALALASGAGTAALAASAGPLLVAAGLLAALAGLALVGMLAPLAFVDLSVSGAMVTAVLAAAVTYALRLLVTERRERHVRRVFGTYLAPKVVAELAEQDQLPALGGETRELTVLFSDLAGFTSRSERMTPEEAIGLANACLAHVVEAVDASGGYVDKFIGDAVMALWNAPAPLADHPRRALEAALTAIAGLARAEEGRERPIRMRIGIECGEAAVGTVGTPGRRAYTAIGDTVNVAARLEQLCKSLDVPILLGPGLAARLPAGTTVPVETVRLAGRETETTVSLPADLLRDVPPDLLESYAACRAAAGANPAQAGAGFARIAGDPRAGLLRGPARRLAERLSGAA
ncbi:CHASE2 domain-containing protein [Alsobacter sp. R-9]